MSQITPPTAYTPYLCFINGTTGSVDFSLYHQQSGENTESWLNLSPGAGGFAGGGHFVNTAADVTDSWHADCSFNGGSTVSSGDYEQFNIHDSSLQVVCLISDGGFLLVQMSDTGDTSSQYFAFDVTHG